MSPTLACWYWVSHGSNTSSLTGCISIDHLLHYQIDRISWKSFHCSVHTKHTILIFLQFFMVLQIIQTVLVDLELKQAVHRSKLAILILKMMISFSIFLLGNVLNRAIWKKLTFVFKLKEYKVEVKILKHLTLQLN